MVSGHRSASSRRTLLALGLAASLCAASGIKAQPLQQAPAAPAAPAAAPAAAQAAPAAADPFKFSNDFTLLVNSIKAAKAADFESAWAAIKDKLSKSDKPGLKEMAEGLKIYKLGTAPQAGADVIYIFHLEPPSKTQSYDPTQILFFSGAFERAEADAIYAKIKDAYVTITPWPLVKVGL
jgi:hypothetical protein